MELEVLQENLTRALSNVGRVASSKAGLPILSNILLRTEKNQLLIAATNLEMAATQTIGAKIAAPGSITIPARLVSEFIHNLPRGTVHLKVENNILHISSDRYNSTINGLKDDEFPELPVIDEKKAVIFAVEVGDFKQAVSQTIITASSDATRPVLTGVYWHTFNKHLYLAATDGYRLSEKKLLDAATDIAAIVPVPTLQEVLRTIGDDVQQIEVLFDETQVRFRLGDNEITSRLIDGNFPDYRGLIPKKSDTSCLVKKDDFTRITKIASLFARDSGGSITLSADADKNSLSVHSIASELGENTSEIDTKISGETASVSLNSRYLNEALGVIDSDEVTFEFSGKLAPCVLVPKQKDETYKHIIMPIKS